MPQNKKEAGSEAALRRVIAGLLLLILLLTCGVFWVLTSKKPGLGPAIDPLDGLILLLSLLNLLLLAGLFLNLYSRRAKKAPQAKKEKAAGKARGSPKPRLEGPTPAPLPRSEAEPRGKKRNPAAVFSLLVLLLLAGGALGILWGRRPAPAPAPAPSAEAAPNAPIPSDDWRLVLINPTHAIEKEQEVEFDEVQGYKFDSRVAGKVRELIAAAKEDGISLAIVSGYRTIEESRLLYANKVAEHRAMGHDEAAAKAEAARWVAPPGTSEHHSGLAMDIVSAGYYTKYSDLVEAFEKEKEAIWLKENCARFGFILRFPKDKTEITGIHFEPWHFRYVGEEHAQAIMEQGICLEEYLGETD